MKRYGSGEVQLGGKIYVKLQPRMTRVFSPMRGWYSSAS
jgi:hypothetical protein